MHKENTLRMWCGTKFDFGLLDLGSVGFVSVALWSISQGLGTSLQVSLWFNCSAAPERHDKIRVRTCF